MSQPLFILCPLRSFSTLVCAMLGQHPDMYGVPELNLFQADNLGALFERLRKRRPTATHGLLRTLAQLHDGKQTEEAVAKAMDWIEEREGWSTRAMLEYVVDAVQPRILIDKSPSTVMKEEFLERMHEAYPDASYLHLTRHPRSTCNSIINLVSGNEDWNGFADPATINPERIWRVCHQNVVEFAAELPEGQCMRIKGEDLLSNLDLYLPQICEWLGIRTDRRALDAMHHPEDSPYAGLGPENARYGNDPNFLKNPVFRPRRVQEPTLEGEQEWAPGNRFSPETIKLTKQFGYR